jgi:hypothetical protein
MAGTAQMRLWSPGFNFQTATCPADTTSRSRRALRASFAINIPPSPIRGRRECRAPGAPAASCAKVESTRVRNHGHTGSPGIPRAMVLTVSFALSPVIGLFCHRRPQETCLRSLLLKNLTPSSRRQDHTTLPSARGALVFGAASRPPHPASTSVTIAKRPSLGAGPNRDIPVSTWPSSEIRKIRNYSGVPLVREKGADHDLIRLEDP